VFDYKNRLLPYGLLFDLIKLLKKKNYEIKVSDELKSLFGNKEKLEITYDLKFQPYYFQKYIIEASLNFKKGLFVSPTASGKSLIISYIINNLMKLNNLKRFLIVVPTTSLILQFYDDLIDYGIDKECIGKFYADEKD
jgi:superfamily II DNA or RNA helicase